MDTSAKRGQPAAARQLRTSLLCVLCFVAGIVASALGLLALQRSLGTFGAGFGTLAKRLDMEARAGGASAKVRAQFPTLSVVFESDTIADILGNVRGAGSDTPLDCCTFYVGRVRPMLSATSARALGLSVGRLALILDDSVPREMRLTLAVPPDARPSFGVTLDSLGLILGYRTRDASWAAPTRSSTSAQRP